jgi:hypothetical protein
VIPKMYHDTFEVVSVSRIDTRYHRPTFRPFLHQKSKIKCIFPNLNFQTMSSSEMTMPTESEDVPNEMAPALLDVTKNREKEGKKETSSTATLEELIDRLEMNELDEDEKGNVVGVCGMKWDVFSSRQLRMICVRFGIKGYKNKKKAQTIEIIERWCKAKKVYQSMQEGYALIREPRKEVQCAF